MEFKQQSLTQEELQFRQRVASVILLFTSNMCTDLQLNPNFKAANEWELGLLQSYVKLLNIPAEVKDGTIVKVDKNTK